MTSSVSSGWGSHPVAFCVAFGKTHIFWTTDQGCWHFLPICPHPTSKKHFSKHGGQKHSKIGSPAQKELSSCLAGQQQRAGRCRNMKQVGNTQVMKKRSPSVLFFLCSSSELPIWDTNLIKPDNSCWFHTPGMDKNPWIKAKIWASI